MWLNVFPAQDYFGHSVALRSVYFFQRQPMAVVLMDQISPMTDHPMATLCVANLPRGTRETDVHALFAQFGPVQRVQLFSGEADSSSQPFGYLDLSAYDVEGVVAALDGLLFNGTIIRVTRISRKPPAFHVLPNILTGAAVTSGDEKSKNLLRCPYEVASVEEAAMPDGGEGSNWCRYVLSSGRDRISGFRRGTVEEVAAYATVCVEDINLRSTTGKSAVSMGYGGRKKNSA